MNQKTIKIGGDTGELRRCPYCDSEDIIGHSVQHNGSHPKRKNFKDCERTFNMKKGTIFYRKKMSRETILTIVYLFLTGYPISNMPPLVHVTERSIRNLLEEVITQFKKYEALIVAPSDYIPKIIEIDEIYIKIQGNREFYGWLAYDAENKYLIDFVTGKREDDTLEKVFRIGDSVEIPLILYNIPSRTGQNVSAETTVALAAEVENIKGVKEASGDLKQVGPIIRSVAEQGLDFTVVAGDDFLTLPIMSLGGKGVISVAANIAPREMSEMVDAMLKGEMEKAKEINIRLFSLFESMFLETNPIPVKKVAEMMGLPAGHVRRPLGALSESNEKKLRKVLERLGMIG